MRKTIFVFAFFCVSSKASILIEPFVGYGAGQSKGAAQASPLSSETISGSEYGARVGLKKLGIMVGAEYLSGNLTLKDSVGNLNLTTSNIGAFIGYQLPIIGLRIYGSYFFEVDGTLKTDPNLKLKSGTGSKIGLGLNSLPFVAINLEYVTTTFKQGDAGNGSIALEPQQKINMVMISLSFPLVLF